MIYIIQWANLEVWSGAFSNLEEAQNELWGLGFKMKSDFLFAKRSEYAKIIPLKLKG